MDKPMPIVDFLLISTYVTLFLLLSHNLKALEIKPNTPFFIFGDSTVDPGNNNYIETIPENQANHKPYAQNGFFNEPTGRFSNGRIIVDYIGRLVKLLTNSAAANRETGRKGLFYAVNEKLTPEYANLPLIPPYLQPSVQYINGVNFASGGAGVLSTTNQGLVIDFKTQLKYFEEVRKSLINKLGDAETKELLSEAVYFISIGSNDYMGGYLGNPRMQELHHPEEYVGMVIGNLTQALQELYEKGGRKFGFLSLSPLGCLPALRAINPKSNEGGCFEEASALALAHNNALKAVLVRLEHLLKGFKYCNSKFYNWLDDRIHNPIKFGFKDGINACCGTGPYGGIYTCGGTKKVTDYELCNNADEYVWWDSFHPTERIHEQLAKALWDGPPFNVAPYNLQHLFLMTKEKLTIADIIDIPETQ